MPDITMCEGGNCPIKSVCYRHIAKPGEYRQSYFIDPPYEIIQGEVNCEYYWK